MTDDSFVSYAQNGEDVVLHRALGFVRHGRYIDVGANDPTVDSVSRAFYQAGWRGITVEPVAEYVARHRAERPDDIQIEAVVTVVGGGTARLHEVPGTGLSTLDDDTGTRHRRAGRPVRDVDVPTRRLDDILDGAGWHDEDIHFLCVDVEGAEGDVLRSIDLRRRRPWIVLAEATRPQTTEPSYQDWESVLLDADYRFALFDGLSRFYVAAEHWDRLAGSLSAPANPLDTFVRYDTLQQQQRLLALSSESETAQARAAELQSALEWATEQLDELTRSSAERERLALATALAWRSRAVGAWAASAAGAPAADSARHAPADHVAAELLAMKDTLSWRITRPLRMVRGAAKKVGR